MDNVNKSPEFSWSLSRHNTICECPRRYALSYYWSNGGWKNTASNTSKHIYRLKTLQSIPMMFGSSIHNQINGIVNEIDNQNQMPTKQNIIANVRNDLNQAYQDSKKRQESWYENPANFKMLSEIYYDNELPVELIQEFQEKMPLTVENLLSCSTFHDLFERQNQIEIITAEKFRFMEVDGVKVWVVLDLVYRDLEKGKFVIVDFKTGKKPRDDGDMKQLLLYGKFIQEAFEIDSLEKIELRNEYLQDGTSITYSPQPIDFSKIDYLLETSIERMYSYLHDIEHNTPKEIEAFEQTEYLPNCKRCNFRELCLRG